MSDVFHVGPKYQPVFRELGIDAEAVFDHPSITVWRSITDRENAVLEATLVDGRPIKWHVKRYRAETRRRGVAEEEVRGIESLKSAGIATVELVGWGVLEDGRSFVISEDLEGYGPADKLIEAGLAFDAILELTAAMAAKLHASGLHHRDLYLCHFFVKGSELRMIDAARVRKIPRWFSRRWIVKDLAQFWYSAEQLGISESERRRWLVAYRGEAMHRAIVRKAAWIGRHDVKLRKAQPNRNISIGE